MSQSIGAPAPKAKTPVRTNCVPRRPVPVLVEIPCICCRKPFMSWDKKLNRRCKPTCERAVW